MTTMATELSTVQIRIGVLERLNARRIFIALMAVLAMLVVVLIVYPMGQTLITTFVVDGQLTLAPFKKLSSARGLSTIVSNTAIYTMGTLLLSTAIGIFLAWANERTDAR